MAGAKTLESVEPIVQMYGLRTNKATRIANDLTVVTGNIIVSTSGKGISFTGTGTGGGVLTNLYNEAATTLAGTQRDIKILIGTVPYYWTVYPTKS
jgi:hypothetical protein